MKSNVTRFAVLMLLSGAASAAPAPVTDLTSGETDLARLEQLINARNHVQIQMQQQLTQLASEIDELRGMVEQNSYELNQVTNRQRDLYREVDSLRNTQPVVTAPVEPEPEDTDVAYSSDVNENDAYDAAVALIMQEKDYAGGIKALDAFLATYPNSAYEANAHYWLGQLHFVQGNSADAKTHFLAVETFKDSNKRADALFKLGILAQRAKNTAEAKKFYQSVIDSYPGSTSATQAQKNLNEL
ncbi:tol-pal system protein YbgF [Thaumasiovibrio subtropicus]|uniref:tol-pal system protein YbgF n=1 Tax=Thaumasiovibrio subtropicus TaxID=1891207 RepID=UPI000B34D001|nr:tol-pal system protein YbgF [Thaumasiovibrio subtropicus]